MAVVEPVADAVLARTNALLDALGFGDRSFARAADLVASVSSMSVALYEKLFQFRLRNVVRVPRTLQDYEHNAQLVVDAMASALLEPAATNSNARASDSSLAPITGRRLCAGDWDAILQLVEGLEQVRVILYDDDGSFRGGMVPVGGDKEREDLVVPASETEYLPVQLKKKANRAQAFSAAPRRKTRRKSARVPSARGELKPRGGSDDGDSEPEYIGRLQPRLIDRRAAKVPSVVADKSSAGQLDEMKQTEVRRTGAVNADLEQHAHARVSRSSSSSSSSPSSSRDPSAHRLAQSLLIEQQARPAELLSKSTSSMPKRARGSTKRAASVRPGSSRSRVRSESVRRSTAAIGAQRSPDASGARSPSVRSERLHAENELLRTQKYGRFVGSDSPPPPSIRNPSSSSHPRDPIEAPAFGDLSSVSIVSKGSRHSLEESTGLEHEFSAVSLHDGESSDPTSRESPDGAVQSEGMARQQGSSSGRALHEVQGLEAMHPNQREAAIGDGDGSAGSEEDQGDAKVSPARKKVARDEPTAPEVSVSSRVIQRDHRAKPLHPLFPATRARTASSRAQAEYLRYKLTLKNHLQELRQRESCQRQHMERAYKAGEHLANVDKIRARRFEQDVRLQRIAIGLEAKEEEEKQLRHAMHHLLDLEKEKLREEHRVTSSVLKQIQRDHEEREQAMETFYANQIRLVREQTEREAQEREVMEKAHRQASEQMMREMRHERESQLAALLQEKQQLAEVRRFRQTTHLTELLERSDQQSAARTDAFYTAAMKARGRRGASQASPSQPQPQRQRLRQSTAAVYAPARGTVRPTASASKVRSAAPRRSTRAY